MSPPDAAKSAKRAFEVLELFDGLRKPATVSAIARALKYPQSSTSILLRAMREAGYLAYDPDARVFSPTIRVALLGAWIHAGRFSGSEILDLLISIHRQTGETSLLATQNGLHMQYVHFQRNEAPHHGRYQPGTMRYLHRVAPGIAILANYHEADVSRMLRHINAVAPEEERADVSAVLARVKEARRLGYAYWPNQNDTGLGGLAMRLPITDGYGNALVIGIIAQPLGLEERRADLVATLRTAIATYLPLRSGQGITDVMAPSLL